MGWRANKKMMYMCSKKICALPDLYTTIFEDNWGSIRLGRKAQHTTTEFPTKLITFFEEVKLSEGIAFKIVQMDFSKAFGEIPHRWSKHTLPPILALACRMPLHYNFLDHPVWPLTLLNCIIKMTC